MTAHERRCRPTAPLSSSILRKRTRAHLEYEKSAPDSEDQFPCRRATTDRPCPKTGRWGESATGSRGSHTSAVPSAGRDKLPGVQARASLVLPLHARVGVTIKFLQAFKL